MSKIIITFISSLLRFKGEPEEHLYSPPGENKKWIPGRQTNEAPLVYFLKKYDLSGSDDRILCFCTKETIGEEYKLDWSEEALKTPGKKHTTLEYVLNRVSSFCKGTEPALSMPRYKIIGIDFEEEDQEQSIAKVMSYINKGDEIFIDTTGGHRNANFVNILLMQALEFKGCKVMEMIYSSFESYTLHRLDSVTRIMEITNAMAEFTTYGRVRLFQKYAEGQSLDADTKEFINALTEFSELLETCRFQKTTLDTNQKRIREAIIALKSPASTASPLMRQLLPAFEEKMLFRDSKVNLIRVVRWCVENNMLQQGLTILNENLIEYLTGGFGSRIFDTNRELRIYAATFIKALAKAGDPVFSMADDESAAITEYCKYGLQEQLYRFTVFLEDSSMMPSDDCDYAVVQVLRCLFENSVTVKSPEEAVRYALQNQLQCLLPFLRIFFRDRTNGVATPDAIQLPEEVIQHYAANDIFIDSLTAVCREKRLVALRNKVIEMEMTHWNAPALDHSILTDSCSFVDIGIVLLEIQLIRLMRHQLNHSNKLRLESDNEESTNNEREIFEAFERMKLDHFYKNASSESIRLHLNIAVQAIQRLMEQAAAMRSLKDRIQPQQTNTQTKSDPSINKKKPKPQISRKTLTPAQPGNAATASTKEPQPLWQKQLRSALGDFPEG